MIRSLPMLALLLVSGARAGVPTPLMQGCPYVETRQIASLPPQGSRYNRFVSMAFRPDGRPVIAYAGGADNAQSLGLIVCEDPECTQRVDRPLESVFSYLAAPGLVLSADGRPLLFANRFNSLRYYECMDATCASFQTRTIETSGQADLRAMVLLPQDRPMMVYSSGPGPDHLDVLARTCTDTTCSSSTVRKIYDVDPDGDGYTYRATGFLDANGLLALAFVQSDGTTANGVIRLLRCTNADCSARTVNTLSTPQATSFPERSSLQILADNRPLAFDGQSSFGANPRWNGLIECVDGPCTDAMSTPLTITGATYSAGLVLLDQSRPVMASFGADQVGLHACSDLDCTTQNTHWVTVASTPSGLESSLGTAPDGRPFLAYFDNDGTHLNALTCAPRTILSAGFE